ncbi:MAG: TIGR00296 family protein [Candidatus Methanofastidiosia archaeon]
MFTREEGAELIRIVRKNIKNYLEKREMLHFELPAKFQEKRGVFVTLKKHGKLRGCIGFPEPIYPLEEALLSSSISAAFRDPRFPPLREEELSDIDLEITILTKPQELSGKRIDFPKKIKIGEDGLIVERGFNKGLLLPQVAKEFGFNAEEFLCETCMKAGLPPDVWLEEDTKVLKFQGQIFSERD